MELFLLHFAAIIWISIFGHPIQHQNTIEGIFEGKEILETVLTGDPDLLEKLILKKVLTELLGDSLAKKINSNEQVNFVETSVSKLIPGISALVLIGNLKSILTPNDRSQKAKQFIENGIYRSLGVSMQVAPQLIRMSLATAQGDDNSWNLEELTNESDFLRSKTVRTMRELKSRLGDQND